MSQSSPDFQVVTLPKTRQAISDMLHEGQKKHMIHGLAEVDVTRPRQLIAQHKAETGERLSFTAFVVACLARAVDENKMMHAYRAPRSRLVLFDEVDVNTQIERDLNGRKWVMPYIIRAANKKSYLDIHGELRTAQVKEVDDAKERKQFDLYLKLPRFARRLFWWVLKRSPQWTKQVAGTVGVTSVGMFGRGGGWGIPITTQTLLLTLGGIAEKPGVVDGRIEIRQYLSLTATVDHDIVDGAPAARFLKHLSELLESGYGLDTVS
ncbi:MAG TPA: 2-oxo acid dehydrogenase subunit E2 [Anaerolineae bacterium]|jgi:pyruvate/2-oxoglutarate dehydrogenase complex dihydrolipoamide acyltransferase (E2) component|nr:2-oxo acid dehydrogenase subunit E2 [Anaerolineae bacterium]